MPAVARPAPRVSPRPRRRSPLGRRAAALGGRRGGLPGLLACGLALSAAAIAAAALGNSAAAPAPLSGLQLSAPGRDVPIGPDESGSVRFLTLLRSGTRPSCLLRWAKGERLRVTWSPGQQWADISGSPRAVDRAFHVRIENYRTPTESVVFGAERQAAVPSGVCGEVAGVGTIHSFTQPTTYGVPQGGLSNVDLLRAYDALPLLQSGYQGQGQTVVFLEVSGFVPSDLEQFAAAEHLPSYNLSVIGKNTGGTEGETPMDIETVHEIAPAAHLVFDNITSISGASSDAALFAIAIARAAQLYPGAIFTASLGLCETDTQIFNRSDLAALNAVIASVEAKGSTMFASSGDSGGLDCTPASGDGQPPQSSFEGVPVPAVLPAVTGTGGTTLSTDSAGNYVGETTWSEPLLSQGSGGGVSHYFGRPKWQTGVGTGGQADTGNGRQVPDVSADADPATGNFIVAGGQASQGGGTSLAAPMWAGFTALWDQLLKANHDRPVGFFNPVLYHLANSTQPYPPFHDITVGGNDFYLATPGYDMVTGLGSPNVANLARDLLAGRF